MKLVDTAVRYPVSVVVVVLLCALFGLLALSRIPIQMIPTIDKPEITVQTAYPGAGPLEVEEEVTKRQEELLNIVENLRELTSTSSEGQSRITLKYDWGVNKDVARLDVSEKLAAVRNLPDDTEEPIVFAVNSDEQSPVAWIVMLADGELNEVRPLAEDVIKAQFERVPGVGQVRFFGGEEREVQVELDLSALAARGISIGQVRSALALENRNMKAGTFNEGKLRHGVRTIGRFRALDDIRQTIVARGPAGVIRVADIASVYMGFEEPAFVVRQNGQAALIFGVLRKTGSNTLDVMTGVREVVNQMNSRYSSRGIQIRIVYDATDYIGEAIGLVTTNLMIGASLATAVLLFFLRSRSAVLVLGLSIPISIITTFVFVWGFGRSLNIISLAGLTFASGMVLDNAIVVVENIFRHLELGKGRFRAAQDGTVEVWGAILASTLTTLAVFVPIILIEDEAGQIFRDIAIAISIAVALSLVVAITVIPMLAARMLQVAPVARADSEPRFDERMAAVLTRLLSVLLGNPRLKAATILAIFGVALASGWWGWQKPDYLPTGNRNLIFVTLRTPPGNNLKQNERLVRMLEERFLPLPETHRMFAVVRHRMCFLGVILKEQNKDKQSIQAFMERLRGMTGDVPGAEVFMRQMPLIRSGGIGQAGLQVVVEGDGLEEIQRIADNLEERIVGVEGVTFVNPSFELGNPEYVVDIDRVRAAELGLTVQEVGVVVETAVFGVLAGTFDDSGREIDLRVRGPRGSVSSEQTLAATVLHTPTGQTVQLADIAQIRARRGPTQIEHTDMDRSVKLFVGVEPQVALGDMVERIETAIEPARTQLPLGYTVRMAGHADDLERMLEAFLPSLGLAAVITFLLLASLFESFIIPVVIFASVPFAASGGILALRVLRFVDPTVKLDTITMLGFVILLGVVVNNAILLVHQALRRLRDGASEDEAVLGSVASRVRPITMTMLTTVFGMSPLIFASGSGSELYRGLGAILVGGLMISTLFTLILVPAVLSIFVGLLRVRGTESGQAVAP